MLSEPSRLRDLTPQQRRSGLAAWLGWLFDGLDMHIYTLVAVGFVAILVNREQFSETFDRLRAGAPAISAEQWQRNPGALLDARMQAGFATADQNRNGEVSRDEWEVFAANFHTGDTGVQQRASWIQAAFLIGWAFGGAFFGRIGDLLGRSRALCLTVLTYALFTGLSFFAHAWWQLLIFRFLAALGIGGEWAVGSTLLCETWPRSWRPWTAAVLQTGVNVGVMIACGAGNLLAGHHPRWIFLIGVVPAVLVFYIRRQVPEPEAWALAQAETAAQAHAAVHAGRPAAVRPSVGDLFRGPARRVTWMSIGICAFSLTAWWAFMFWQAQHLRALPEVKLLSAIARDTLVISTFYWIIGISIVGNFAAGWLARLLGYKRTLLLMFGGFVLTMSAAFGTEHPLGALTHFWLPAVGFWSGVFGLFTMMLPPLFPTLLRTTGAGFCYNIGRIAAALGTIFAAQISPSGNFRQTLFYVGFLYLPAMVFTIFLPLDRAAD